MTRPIAYTQSQVRSYDHLHAWKDAEYARGQISSDMLGATGTVVTGLGATQTGSPSLTINIAQGDIYALAAIDTNAYGSLLADASQTMMQGFAAAQTVLLTTSGLASGQSRYALITAAFSQTDSIPADDPTAGILNYYNSVTPTIPLVGPGGAGTSQNTRRSGVCTIGVTYGTVATTGSEVPPNAPGGTVGLYLVDLAFGQTTVTTAQILLAGPSVGSNVPSNYAAAPFLAGLTSKPTVVTFAGNPNANVAGRAAGALGVSPTLCLDTVDNSWWTCAVSGPAATAVWMRTGGAGIYKPTQVNFTAVGAYSWTVPAGVFAIKVRVWGGGGGGGAAVLISGAAGGGAGGYFELALAVVPGQAVTGSVGAAGAGGIAGGANGSTGLFSSVTYNSVTYFANGGIGATNAASTGTVTNSVAGGGITGTVDLSEPGQPSFGATQGYSGSGTTILYYGGNGGMAFAGGYGGNAGTAGANAGNAPGGGGGGSAANSGSNQNGGAGAAGQVQILY